MCTVRTFCLLFICLFVCLFGGKGKLSQNKLKHDAALTTVGQSEYESVDVKSWKINLYPFKMPKAFKSLEKAIVRSREYTLPTLSYHLNHENVEHYLKFLQFFNAKSDLFGKNEFLR